MTTGLIILLCIVIVIGFCLDIAVYQRGPTYQPPPSRSPPDDPPSE